MFKPFVVLVDIAREFTVISMFSKKAVIAFLGLNNALSTTNLSFLVRVLDLFVVWRNIDSFHEMCLYRVDKGLLNSLSLVLACRFGSILFASRARGTVGITITLSSLDETWLTFLRS